MITKALYIFKNYHNPLLDIEDKIGIRIIFLTTEHIYNFNKLLQDSVFNWEIKTTKDFKEESFEYPKNFDYQSLHLIVKPSLNNSDFEDDKKKYLTCEIQLRTILQHALAELSHDTTYKGPFRNDKEILRILSKSIALMEATDDYFINIFSKMNDTSRKYANIFNELISFYKKYIKTDYDTNDIDNKITDSLITLIDQISINISDIDKYCQKETSKLKDFFTKNDSVLINQPIILLILYCIENKTRQLKDNWTLSQSVLEDLFTKYGYSFKDF